MSTARIYCCVCAKQAVRGQNPTGHDRYITKLEGARAGVKAGEVFCGYCALELDENGMFPEEAAQVSNL